MGLGKEYHRGELLFSLCHIKGTWNVHENIGDINLGQVVKVVFARFLHHKVTIFLIPYSILGKWVIKSNHIQKGKVKYVYKLFGILLLLRLSFLPHLLF